MTYRPWPFSLVSFGFLALALSMPVQSAYLFELPLYAIVDQIGHMTDLNLTIFVLLIVQSPLIWKAHRSIKISVPLTAILVLINNFYVGTYGFQFNMVHSSIASLYFLGLCGFIFLPESLFALNHPNKRWWMSPERAKKNLPIKLSTHTLSAFEARTFDISSTGAFICVESKDQRENYKIGDKIDLAFFYNNVVPIKLSAHIVRIANQENGKYPLGMGVEFVTPDKIQKRLIRELTH